MIHRVAFDRYDEDGNPDPNGDLDCHFFDASGRIVASVTVKPNGWACAHVIDAGNKIIARAVIEPSETEEAE
jgi:hypothetical protein